MTLRLAVELTARDQGLKPELERTRRDIEQVGQTAARAGQQSAQGARAAAAGFAEQAKAATAAAGATERLARSAVVDLGRYRTQIQGLGFQISDVAVQIASGQSALVALTQQGSQALQLFGGPWGAVIGAALSIAGAFAAAMFNLAGATKSATEAQQDYADALDTAKDLLRTSKENAEARAQAELNLAKAKLAVVVATQKEIAAEAQAKAARLEGVNPGRAMGRDPRADQAAAQQQADRAIAKAREAEELLAKLNDPNALGRTREAAAAAAESTKSLTVATGDLNDTVAQLLVTFDPLPGSFSALARAEAELELQFERGQIAADEYARRLTELYDAQDALAAKQAAGAGAIPPARQRELERTAEESADQLGEPFKNAAGEIGDAFGDAFEGIFRDGKTRFGELASAGRSILLDLAIDLARMFAFRPIAGAVLGAVGIGGAPSLSIQTASGVGGGVGGIGSGSSGFGGLSLSSFGGGAGLGDIFGAIVGRDALFTPVRTIGSAGATVGGAPTALGNLANWLNTPLGGGIGGGLLGFGASLLSGQGLAQSAITGGLTGIGTGIGSIFGLGPIGGMVGGLLGSLVGGLFGKKPKLKKHEAEAFIEANAFGLPVLDIEREDGKLGNLGNDLAKLARSSIGDLLGSVGALMPDNVRSRLSYYHSTKGGKTKSEFYKASLYDTGIPGLTGEIGRFKDAETAAQVLAAGTLFMSGLTGNIQGTGASTDQAFQNLWKQAGRKVSNIGQFDAEMLTETIGFTKWLDGLDKVRTESDAAAKALIDLNAQLNKLNSQAEDLGLDTAKVLEAMKRDFAETVSGELLALTDPQAFALQELEKEYAARKAVAEQLGVELVELEKLYALKRQQILDQNLQGVADTWADFINQLQFGGASALSPTAQLENARLQYETAKGQGGAAFREAAATYLGLLQSHYGGTLPYAQVFEEVIALAKQFGGLGGIPGYASGGDHPGGLMWINEEGPELVATGPARVFNARETAEILHGRRRRSTANENEGGAEAAHLVALLGSKFDALAREQDRLNKNLRLLIERERRRDAA